MVQYFLDGGPFMYPILGLLIFGLGFGIERVYTLFRASVNTIKFMTDVRTALHDEGRDKAVEICSNTRGPVAEIFHAGLSRSHRGIEAVEKGIENAGTIEMAFLEKNMVWLSTVVTLAPMLGFTGTVAGMIQAFDDIKAANDISPAVVAGGISIALLTTLFGLVVAIIIQTFQNFLISRVDKLIIDMEENSVMLIDELVEMEIASKQE
ncbi:MAG TPA: MotA/TolQ/ExbB proton channel family protein [Candidatus Marinimicrobia bacterium]|jgi:biopolymer transport protein ExbB|nr:flagellar motor protein MotA [Candidatus Neomarinimicrobiota bacterium]MDP6296990.1 MotA/TolQ/ExbB proton channel family protein [Candidatus Neomarinimicrobiota bacterium]MDP7121105.1 MotA/TolQ/ExbB proton channel family protein [Candidatus Neomarinimicrobiota bacterium]MDP7483800.1 MotA/TolQ/ExbB proton channel family protein [Candidatus Neomarinimicrobiota bacterium]MDP7529276.1 MotA/TolQ/ExbB proton channel family protein [Candidatus Neomarinimicrobiota bacterium]